jgi:hypothetical protein
MEEPDQRMWCQECHALRVLTESGAIICPNGHGMVLSNFDKRLLKTAERDQLRWKWLRQFPVCTPLTSRSGTIDGKLYTMHSPHPFNTSFVEWLADPKEWLKGQSGPYVIAQWNGEARCFRPLRKNTKGANP